jgi:hypothetical protein
MSGSSSVLCRWFDTLSEATEFGNKLPLTSVLEIKYYPKENKREDRT